MNLHELIDRLHKEHTLTRGEFITLIKERDEENASYLASLAREEAVKIYGNGVFPRGLVEFTNYCKNNCYYCGIQGSNQYANRYRLSKDEILSACENGYQLGYRSFVLQGGEDPHYSDDVMVPIVSQIRKRYQDCAITLSLGERSKESYQKLYDAGADRYLLRHEAATPELYQKLHPESLSLENRIQCLWNLKEIGYAVGTGFMVGAPYQTVENLVDDLLFIQKLDPQMVGIGPFVPHHDTKFKDYPSGTVELTTYLTSILRLMNPHLLLPATTALGTIDPRGREKGILAGANVVMPNLSPVAVRKDYSLYDNKICTVENLVDDLLFIQKLDPQMVGIGPFVPHHDTKFKDYPSGTVELTTYLTSILRLMNPHLLLPATTALGTIDPRGREKGILAGANVVMPNLSPVAVRKDYSLYDNKICTGEEAAECAGCLGRRLASIDYELVFTRGDYIE